MSTKHAGVSFMDCCENDEGIGVSVKGGEAERAGTV